MKAIIHKMEYKQPKDFSTEFLILKCGKKKKGKYIKYPQPRFVDIDNNMAIIKDVEYWIEIIEL